MQPAVINIKLKLLLPTVRSSDGQEEGEDEGEIHSLGFCYSLWLSLRTGQAQMYGKTMREKKTHQWGCF